MSLKVFLKAVMQLTFTAALCAPGTVLLAVSFRCPKAAMPPLSD